MSHFFYQIQKEEIYVFYAFKGQNDGHEGGVRIVSYEKATSGICGLTKKENWDQFKKELFNFPSKKSHDDLIDGLALLSLLATTSYAKQQDDEEWEPLDAISGI